VGRYAGKYTVNIRRRFYCQTFNFLAKLLLEWELNSSMKFRIIHAALSAKINVSLN
jgi:hypothetical protein